MKQFFLLMGLALAGCSPGNHPEMLGNTNLVAVEGNIPQEMQAPDSGRMCVYDLTVKHRLFTSSITAGQSFVIDPITRHAIINGKLVTNNELPSGHELKIVFTRTD